MTPAQEAKEYARQHGFVIGTIPAMKRYTVNVLNAAGVADERIAEVGSYPAALNAMKRHVEATLETLCIAPEVDALLRFAEPGEEWQKAFLALDNDKQNTVLELASGKVLDAVARAWEILARWDLLTDAEYRDEIRYIRNTPSYKAMQGYMNSDFGITPLDVAVAGVLDNLATLPHMTRDQARAQYLRRSGKYERHGQPTRHRWYAHVRYTGGVSCGWFLTEDEACAFVKKRTTSSNYLSSFWEYRA